MFKSSATRDQLSEFIKEMPDLDFARFLYCQEMAGAFLAVGKFEDMLVTAMHMCDKVKLEKVIGSDKSYWEQSLSKKALLQGSTLGSLIKILERHGVWQQDINYLKRVKGKRDYFVHRLFHDGAWPGELNEEGCRFMTRRLLAIQLWLARAERKIWRIFERAGFVELDSLGDGSFLAVNVGIYELSELGESQAADGDS